MNPKKLALAVLRANKLRPRSWAPDELLNRFYQLEIEIESSHGRSLAYQMRHMTIRDFAPAHVRDHYPE